MIFFIKDREILVDDADWERIKNIRWFISTTRNRKPKQYVRARHNGSWVLLHRFLLDADKGTEIDHIDSNTLDNRRSNLRFVSRQQNAFNAQANTGKQYKGVSFDKPTKLWKARITLDYKLIFIGRFKTEEEAARAYDLKAKELYGEYARLNFEGE